MITQSVRKPFSNPKPKRSLPGDPEPRPTHSVPKPSLPGDPKPRPRKPDVLPDPMPRPVKR
jgi:hypothetical protein